MYDGKAGCTQMSNGMNEQLHDRVNQAIKGRKSKQIKAQEQTGEQKNTPDIKPANDGITRKQTDGHQTKKITERLNKIIKQKKEQGRQN